MPNGSADEWETDWRRGVDTKLDKMMGLIQGLVERTVVNESAIRDIRDEKRAAPRLAQGWIEVLLMLLFGAISALCGGGGLIISLANLLMAHWH